MKADFVVDVGNARIKWGRCSPTGISDLAALPPDDTAAYMSQLTSWGVTLRKRWVVSGVAPQRRDALVTWLRGVGQQVRVLTSHRELALTVKVEAPEQVGIDRLLNAVAANSRRPADQPAVVIDAGSAVTVDWLDAAGAFCGGAIFPGLRTMAQALHDCTAALPLVQINAANPPVPATNTQGAIAAGVVWSVVGGIQTLVAKMSSKCGQTAVVFLGGGDAPVLAPGLDLATIIWPQLTLEGIRIAAEGITGAP